MQKKGGVEKPVLKDIIKTKIVKRDTIAIQIEVAGHTDNVGAVAANEDLTLKRANTVVKYLVGKGANIAQYKAKGYGSIKPIADNSTTESRAQNLRVEYTVIGF